MTAQGKRPPLFGTNGIRGIPNEDLTVEFSMKIGAAAGTYFSQDTVAMGRDTRSTGPMIFNAVSSGIMAAGKNVLDLGVLPTPAVQYYCKTHAVPGVVITASHNPPQFNGIKCIASDGTELSRSEEEKIEDIYYESSFRYSGWGNAGNLIRVNDAIDIYLDGVMKHVDKDAIRAYGFRVAVDAGNGASYFSAPELLRRLGCTVVSLNAYPDGHFTSRNSEPKPENLMDLINVVRNGKFSLGIAHDGDADRAVFVDEKGNFIDGDTILSLIVSSVTKPGDRVVTPISSSDAIDEICRKNGAELIRTRVGAPIVSRTMIEMGARIGGEENGGIIYGPHQYCRDGAMTAGLVLNLMASRGERISELIKDVPEFHIHKLSVERKVPWEQISKFVRQYAGKARIESSDGLKIFFEDGWVLMRPSGTEPIIRIYGQSRTAKRAAELAEEYRSLVEGIQDGASAL